MSARARGTRAERGGISACGNAYSRGDPVGSRILDTTIGGAVFGRRPVRRPDVYRLDGVPETYRGRGIAPCGPPRHHHARHQLLRFPTAGSPSRRRRRRRYGQASRADARRRTHRCRCRVAAAVRGPGRDCRVAAHRHNRPCADRPSRPRQLGAGDCCPARRRRSRLLRARASCRSPT